ncbi:MAG TPA: chorismate mutase [Aliidongia sp.]|uniref:chorismate mutase n=1 Tax=Aliidongia sp. TaxID=1914230 RepID=UPI002DDCCA72|nr:chorismate mutase [Aliidongia sp.]HEV2675990.1 chorismate mutase [Aliidongia sp.]
MNARPLLLLGLSSLALLVGLGTVACGADEPAPTGTKAFWGKPQAAGGTCCDTLGEVRSNIDRIDRQIVALIGERGSFVREAARFKANPAAVEDKARVEQIIARLRGLAVEDKAPPDVVEATYRALIAAYTDEERKISATSGAKP